MDWQERISIDPKVLAGKPVVKGTRISVELILDLLAQGWTQPQILASPEEFASFVHQSSPPGLIGQDTSAL
jgi:hypothetical protein